MIKHISVSKADRLQRYGYTAYRGEQIVIGKLKPREFLEALKTSLCGVGAGLYLMSFSLVLFVMSPKYLFPSVAVIERGDGNGR